jgi:hypothetical protein
MKSNTKSMSSSLIGSNCRMELTEWLVKFGTRWVNFHEIQVEFKLGYPEREGYIERRTDPKLMPGEYIQFRLTDKGLEFINDGRADT